MRSMLRKEPSKRPTAERVTHHPWFNMSSPENSQCSSLRTRCISDLGASVSSYLYSQQQNVSRISVNTSSLNDKTSTSSGCKRCTTSLVTPPDNELTLAADCESLSRKNYDHLTATYLLLGEKLNRPRRRLPFFPSPLRVDYNSTDIKRDIMIAPIPLSDSVKTAKSSLDDSAVDVKHSYSHLQLIDSPFTTQPISSNLPRPLDFAIRTCVINNLPCTNLESFSTCLSIDAQATTGHSTFLSSTIPSMDEESSERTFPRVTGACGTVSNRTSISPLTSLTTKADEKLSPRRNLTRRKYGIRFRDDDLCEFTRNVLGKQVNMDRPTDSDISKDGALALKLTDIPIESCEKIV